MGVFGGTGTLGVGSHTTMSLGFDTIYSCHELGNRFAVNWAERNLWIPVWQWVDESGRRGPGNHSVPSSISKFKGCPWVTSHPIQLGCIVFSQKRIKNLFLGSRVE